MSQAPLVQTERSWSSLALVESLSLAVLGVILLLTGNAGPMPVVSVLAGISCYVTLRLPVWQRLTAKRRALAFVLVGSLFVVIVDAWTRRLTVSNYYQVLLEFAVFVVWPHYVVQTAREIRPFIQRKQKALPPR